MERATYPKPPMINTNLTPMEIIGWDNKDILVAHLRICFSSTNAGEFPHKRIDKEIGAANREMVSKVLEELRQNGYHPLSVDKSGKIRWGIVLKSDSHMEYEKGLAELQKLPISKLQEMGRSGYRKFMKDHVIAEFKGYGINRNDVIGNNDTF